MTANKTSKSLYILILPFRWAWRLLSLLGSLFARLMETGGSNGIYL